MTGRRIAGIFAGLGIGLLFYLAHRSDRTVSNQMLSWWCGPGSYSYLKQEVRHWLPVPMALRGCLPSGLWCFVVTSLVSGWSLRLGRDRTLPLAWSAPIFNAGVEVAQWLHWTDGHADGLDVIAGLVGGVLAQGMFPHARRTLDIPWRWNWRLGLVAAGFACMGLADVWQ